MNIAALEEFGLGASRALSNTDNILSRTLQNQELPSNQELLQGLKNYATDFAKDPAGAWQRGWQRDAAANRIANMAGYTRQGLVSSAINEYKDPIKDLVVNIGGMAGSSFGTDLPTQLAGDWAGAYLARRSIDDTAALVQGIHGSVTSPEWQASNLFDKAKSIHDNVVDHVINNNIYNLGNDVYNDTIGWGIGNGVAQATTFAPIPLRGATVALGYGQDVGTAFKRAMQGDNLGQVIPETFQQMANKPTQFINNGLTREADMRDRINTGLRQINSRNALNLLNDHLS